MSSVLQKVMSAYRHPEKLKIKDLTRVGALVDALVEKGPELFQVIADFDFTLTKSVLPDGRPGESGMGVMTYSPLMTDTFRARSVELFKKYHPIEIDHCMTTQEKIPFMVEWYEQRRDQIAVAGITKTDIKNMVAICNVALRDGARTAMSNLNDCDVPILIFSAGNGTINEECLRREDALFPNQKVVSNFMKFDDTDQVIGYENTTLIHTFNKNEHAVEHTGYFKDLQHRCNALVLGDSIGDLSMSDGMPNSGTVLKIGFLNIKIEERLESFEQGFDVVIIDDQSFDFVNLLLDFILRKSS